MNKEIILSPEELYYLGSLMQARYIDYAYVSAIRDTKKSYKLIAQESKAKLVDAGILMEDFGGDLELDTNVRQLLAPIFYGEYETTLDVCKVGDEKSAIQVCKFHFFDGMITMVTAQQGKLEIKTIDQLVLRQLVEALVPAGYAAETQEITEQLDVTVTRLIVAKNILVGQRSTVSTFLEADKVLYQEQAEGIRSLSKDDFISTVYDIIKGV